MQPADSNPDFGTEMTPKSNYYEAVWSSFIVHSLIYVAILEEGNPFVMKYLPGIILLPEVDHMIDCIMSVPHQKQCLY